MNVYQMLPAWFIWLLILAGWGAVIIYLASDDDDFPGPGPACGGD